MKTTRKNGTKSGKQVYKCIACGKQFIDIPRLQPNVLWEEYIEGKQPYEQLATKYQCSAKTIQRKIDTVQARRVTTFSNVANVLMDTTYFERKFGVMVYKDSISGQILYKQYVKQETNKLYLAGLEEIARRGIKIQAVICDGRKGLLQMSEGIPF